MRISSLLFAGLLAVGVTACGTDGDDVGTHANGAASLSGPKLSADRIPAEPPVGGIVCGTRGSRPCADGQFCDFPSDSQCGATDQGGRCSPKPDACTEQYDPVCGCDGKTYGNECEAHSAGIDVTSEGRCPGDVPDGKTCGGIAGIACDTGEFCNLEPSSGGLGCGVADATGTCEEQPMVCTKQYEPVCGCDGKTYGNPCMAHSAGMSIASKGACEDEGPQQCGGLMGASCGKGEFCNFEGRTNDCGAADGMGACESVPQVCTAQWDPVCGCDGKTYATRCSAHGSGVSVASEGECKKQAVNCDAREVLCRRAAPVCPPMHVPSVNGSCWGECVKIDQCSCSEENDCPQRNQYVCHRFRGQCGPYVR